MKRILTVAFAAVLLLAMCIIPVSAADSYTLLPADGEWTTVAGPDGNDITVNVTDEATVFSASASWPCANCHYTEDQIVKSSIDDYSLVYEFTVETGATNINFTFTDGFGNSAGYSISNTTLGDVNYDSGSGDLTAGEYKGAVKLSDLIKSTMYFGGTAFPKTSSAKITLLSSPTFRFILFRARPLPSVSFLSFPTMKQMFPSAIPATANLLLTKAKK